MKRVKLMSVALVALSMVAVTSVNAQPQQREKITAEQMAERSSERMAKSLDLTEDQKSQIYAINLKYAEERQAKMEEMKAEREEKRSERPERGDRPERGEGRDPQMQQGRGDNPRGGAQMAEERKAQLKEIIAVLTVDQVVEFIEMSNRPGNHQPQGRPGGRRGGEQMHRAPQGGHPQGGPRGGRPEGGRPHGGEGSAPCCGE